MRVTRWRAGFADLFDGVAHVPGGDELALFDVDGAVGRGGGLGGGDEEVGLAAEEGGDLEHGVDGAEAIGELGGLLGGVDVGEDRKAIGLRDGAEDACAFCDAGAAEGVDGGAVRLVVTGFEDVRNLEIGGDALDGVGHAAGVRLGLDDAGAGDEEERAAAERDAAEVEAGGVRHRVIGA